MGRCRSLGIWGLGLWGFGVLGIGSGLGPQITQIHADMGVETQKLKAESSKTILQGGWGKRCTPVEQPEGTRFKGAQGGLSHITPIPDSFSREPRI